MVIAGATSARECALAIAIPWNLDEVHAHLRCPARHDYAKAMRGPLETLTADAAWRTHFLPAIAAWKICRPQLEELGVTILSSAGRAGLRELLTGKFRTVTFLGHWKGHVVLPSDLSDAPGIAREIASDHSRLCMTLGSLVDTETLNHVAAAPPGSDQARIELARTLTQAIESGAPLFAIDLDQGERLALTTLELCEYNRHQLDIWFAGRLIAGNRLELRDGLLAADDVAALVPDDFAGCLHLANCHSSLLQRTLASPLRRVLAQEDILLPRVFFEIYRAVVSLLGSDGHSYPDLWLSILKDLRGRSVEIEQIGWAASIRALATPFRKLF
jgi:hypothetical protein